MNYLETPIAVMITKGYYYGCEAEIIGSVDLGDELGVWWYTDTIENEYCLSYDMWFKRDEFEILGGDEE